MPSCVAGVRPDSQAVRALLDAGSDAPMKLQIAGYTGTLFVVCMICHGELYQLKPAPRYLTQFYLTISLGGALGGELQLHLRHVHAGRTVALAAFAAYA